MDFVEGTVGSRSAEARYDKCEELLKYSLTEHPSCHIYEVK